MIFLQLYTFIPAFRTLFSIFLQKLCNIAHARMHFYPAALFKILHAGLKDLQILLSVDVHGHAPPPALHMGHLAQHPSIRARDALDGKVGAVHIPLHVI